MPPSSVGAIGYDRRGQSPIRPADFYAALKAGNLPQVSSSRRSPPRMVHPGYSGPLDEQNFIARVLNGSSSAGLGLDRHLPRLRRLRRLVRPRHFAGIRNPTSPATSSTGSGVRPPPLPPAATAAAAGPGRGCRCSGLALGEAELPRPHPDRAGVDHRASSRTTRTSGRIGDQSFDARAASLNNMFDFHPRQSAGAEAVPGLRDRPAAGRRAVARGDRPRRGLTRDRGRPPTATPTATASPTAHPDSPAEAHGDPDPEARGQAQLPHQRRRQARHGLVHRRAARTPRRRPRCASSS